MPRYIGNTIRCPYCGYDFQGISWDYVDGEEMEGSFVEDCTECKNGFHVRFEIKPLFTTSKEKAPN
jgi:hypothetical protein